MEVKCKFITNKWQSILDCPIPDCKTLACDLGVFLSDPSSPSHQQLFLGYIRQRNADKGIALVAKNLLSNFSKDGFFNYTSSFKMYWCTNTTVSVGKCLQEAEPIPISFLINGPCALGTVWFSAVNLAAIIVYWRNSAANCQKHCTTI